MMDILIGIGGTIAVSSVTAVMLTLIKKGKFELWGIKSGQFVSKFGRMKLGKAKWERIENSITVAIISFSQGFKKGADLDDDLPDSALLNQVEKGKNGS